MYSKVKTCNVAAKMLCIVYCEDDATWSVKLTSKFGV